MRAFAFALAVVAALQGQAMAQGPQRIEIALERLDGSNWTAIDPALVLAQGDRVRFRFHSNFDGYLYVMNQSTSGKYEQLFPREETGQENRIAAGMDYKVTATSAAFRIAGPPGHEVVYWIVTPARLTDAAPRFGPPPSTTPAKPIQLMPRCDESVLRARGDCIDSSAGPKLVPRGADVPGNIAQAAQKPQGVIVLRQKETAVISSPEPLTGPVVYEFRLAHR
jgi:hypothetical protein